ncbi:MAG: diguanylate cyclase [Halomonadaceae bacterium]|nr:MAG: diguanylate cyclase [Halomonadaceae bacterium]
MTENKAHLMLHRLRKDFRLSLILLLGVCGILGLGPFAIYRLIIGDMVMAILDGVLILGILGAMIYVWISDDTRRTGIFLALFNTSIAIIVTHLIGIFGLFWLYVVLLGNFFLVRVEIAVTMTVIALVAVVLLGTGLEGLPEQASFVITAAITSLFAYIFAHRADIQRMQLEQLATLDPLTGAGNRLALESELNIALAAHKRRGKNHGLLMLDLDHFKGVNDSHGHATGDRILKQFTELVLANTRTEDRLFRFGGEEFVLLMPGSDLQGMTRASEHLLQCLRENLQTPSGPVTTSIGAALLRPEESWESWLGRADHALYAAKEQGRNRVVLAADEAPAVNSIPA